ncbi:MAG: polyketide synthase dehydratase domain-containing protein, partial [Mycobacterium sp.]
DPGYWVDNLCSPVQFSPALRRLLDTGHDTFVEISPHPILLTPAREDAEDLGRSATLLASMRRDDEGRATMLASLGTLYTLGHPVAWGQLYPSDSRCIAAPTYPWQRVHSWLDAGSITAPRHNAVRHATTGPLSWRGPLRSAVHPETVLAEVEIGTDLMPELADHRVNGSVVLPTALLLRLVLAGAAKAFGSAKRVMRDVTLHRPLEFTDAAPHTVQFVLQGDPSNVASFECYSAEPDTSEPSGPERWSLLASGTVAAGEPTATDNGPHPLDAARARCIEEIPGSSFYRRLADHGLQYGPKFQAVEKVWRREGEAVARLTSAGSAGGIDDLDAAVVLDVSFQTLAAALPESRSSYLPSGLTELQTRGMLTDGVWCHAVLREDADLGPDTLAGDVFLLRDDGEIVVAARGLRLRRIPGVLSTAAAAGLRDRIYQLRWQPASIPPDGDAPSRAVETGSWLIFSDGGAAADTLRDHLESRSQSCVLAEPGKDFECLTPDSYRLDPARPEHFRRLLKEAFGSERPPCRGVVHLWSLLAAPPADTSPDSLEAATTLGSLSLLYLLQALSLAGWSSSPRLWLVTRATQTTETMNTESAEVVPVSIAQASVWGMSRSIDHEHPELHCSCVDLSAGGGPEELRALFQEVWSDSREVDVALRGYRRYVARLTRYDEVEP